MRALSDLVRIQANVEEAMSRAMGSVGYKAFSGHMCQVVPVWLALHM